MPLLRESSFVLALLLGGATAWAGGDARAPLSARAQLGVRFKTPFKKGLPAIGAGPLVTLQGKQHVDARQYADLSKATQHLLSLYPAEKHFFVGIGRDPAPIIAFLQNLGGKELAINFPASSNEAGNATPEILKKYVDKLIPPGILESGRTIVFVDATTSGRALDFYVPRIAPSLKGASYIKAAYGIQHNGQRNSWAIYNNPGDKKVIDTTAFPEVNRFFTDPYEDVVSEFPRHGPGTHPMSVLDSPLPQYAQYRQALMQRMERDEQLHGFLTAQPAFHEGSPEELKQAAIAERLQLRTANAAERSQKAKVLADARALPTKLKSSLAKLVKALPERTESHEKGPYLSESAEQMNTWLKEALGERDEAAKLAPAIAKAGPNLVVSMFMDEVEHARKDDRIRNRDYRRLMGHALSAATMDEEMLRSLVKRFETSKHFRREITDEGSYYLNAHAEKARPETAQMAAHYQTLMTRLPASAQAGSSN